MARPIFASTDDAMMRRRQRSGLSDRAQHHEHLAADDEVPAASDRAVGLVLAAAGALVALAPLVRGRAPRLWLLALAALLLLLALARPRWLRPLKRAWLGFGAVANMIVTSLLMAVVFYGIITPIAWVMRRLGHDVLNLRLDPLATTYWLERQPPGSSESMKHQF